MRRLKFKLTTGKGSVDSFMGPDGKVYHPGDIVELPASYKGQKWLEPVGEEPKPLAPPSKIKAAPEVAAQAEELPTAPAPEETPLSQKKRRRVTKKAE